MEKLETFLIERKIICYKCLKCNHTWIPRGKKPQICPKCKSRTWYKNKR